MKALTITQPWSHGIIHLGKDIENRDWQTKVRGTVAIHAGMRNEPEEFKTFFDLWLSLEGKSFLDIPIIKESLVFGAIIGLVEIADCVSAHPSPWFYGKWGFVLENPRALKTPIPCKGKLNFWTVPEEIEKQILEQTK